MKRVRDRSDRRLGLHLVQTAAARFRHEEQHEAQAEQRDDRVQPESAV